MIFWKKSDKKQKELVNNITAISKIPSKKLYQLKINGGIEIINQVINKSIHLTDEELRQLKRGQLDPSLFTELLLLIDNWVYYKSLPFVFGITFELEVKMNDITIYLKEDGPLGCDSYTILFEKDNEIYDAPRILKPHKKIPLIGFREYLFIFSLAEKPGLNCVVYKKAN